MGTPFPQSEDRKSAESQRMQEPAKKKTRVYLKFLDRHRKGTCDWQRQSGGEKEDGKTLDLIKEL